MRGNLDVRKEKAKKAGLKASDCAGSLRALITTAGVSKAQLARAFGCRVLATDIDSTQLVVAARRLRRRGLLHHVALATADGGRLPSPEGRYDLARKMSPLSEVRKKNVPPILSIHGNADDVVPYDQSIELTKTLRNVKADAEMIAIANGGHGFPPEVMSRIYPQVFEFLRRRRILK